MGQRTLEELKEILKQENEDFNRLVEEAERRSNGNESSRLDILTKLVVPGFVARLKVDKDGEVSHHRLVLAAPEHPRANQNPRKKSRSTINAKVEEQKRRRARVSTEDANRLRERTLRMGLPEDVRAKMEQLGGAEPVLVITKNLFATDMAKQSSRFNLPLNKLEPEVNKDERFLSEPEWTKVNSNSHEEIKARLVGPMFSDPTEVSLKGWTIGKGISLVVTGTGWNQFVDKHAGVINVGDKVQLWASRCNNQEKDLLLALVVVEHASPPIH